MQALANTLMAALGVVIQVWAAWAMTTGFVAVVIYAMATIVSRPDRRKIGDFWWNYGLLGPSKLAVALLRRPAKKRKT